MKKIISVAAIIFICLAGKSQNIAINETGAQPDTSAMLDISSTTKGLLAPRMDKAQKNAIPQPGTGLLVFQTGPDSAGFHYYDGTQWLWMATAAAKNAWALTGNAGTDSSLNFLGTTDNKPIMLRQNNLPMGQLNTSMHNFFIGGAAGAGNTAMQNTGFGDSALNKNTTASGNTAIGYRSMTGTTSITGGLNTAIGANALPNVTSGIQNVALGANTLISMKTGINNIASGAGAMEFTAKGDGNIALGSWALRNADSANLNIAIGQEALYSNDSSRNIAIGYQSLYYNNRRSNMAVGYQAGVFNSYLQSDPGHGTENTYLGFQTGYYANTGSQNVAIGARAMMGAGYFNSDVPANTSYKRNVAIGDSALFYTTGSDNVAIGYRALSKSDYTGNHVAIGSRALLNTTATYPNTAVGYSSQDSCSTGMANTSLGSYSLVKNTKGYNNTAIGNAAMFEAVNTANPAFMYDNTAVGNDALRFIRYSGETAVGAGALRSDTGSKYNTALGYLAMYNHLNGNSNTAVGTSALRNDINGYQNTAIGTNAMFYRKTNGNNTAVGFNALLNDTSGYGNTAIGSFALNSLLQNSNNTAVGNESMYFDINGYDNTAMGWRSLRYAKNPEQNTALGVGALEFSDSANFNVAIGRGAMMGKGGLSNTAIGFYSSGLQNGVATTNYYVNQTTTIGAYAGLRNIADNNTFIGFSAGNGSTDSLRGIENIGIGAYALFSGSTGKSNTAIGQGAIYSNTTGNGNVALGTRALAYSNTNYNIAVGDSALYNNNGNANLAIGTSSMRFNGSGQHNAAAGNFALMNNVAGSRNTGMGDSALVGNSGGTGNTGVGYGAFSVNVSGNYNTAVGYNTNASTANLVNATAVGANAFVAQNNSMVLGSINGINGATADTKVGIGTTTPDSTFSVAGKFSVGSSGTIQFDNAVPVMNYMFKSGSNNANRMLFAHSPSFSNWGLQYQDAGDRFNFVANGNTVLMVDLGGKVGVGMTPTHQFQLSTDDAAKLTTSTWTITSDIRLKTVDGNYTKGLKDIVKLNTIMYHYAKGNARNLDTNVQAYGFSAQEVQKVFPEAVTEEKDGYLSLNIHPILVAYVNAFKEQQQEIEALKKQVEEKDSNKEVIEKLLKRIEALEAKTATK